MPKLEGAKASGNVITKPSIRVDVINNAIVREGSTSIIEPPPPVENGIVVFFGGNPDGPTRIDAVEIYDVLAGTKSAGTALANDRSSGSAICSDEDTAWLFGGWLADGNSENTIYSYVISTETEATSSTTLLANRVDQAIFGDDTKCFNINNTTSEKFIFSTEAISSSGALTTARSRSQGTGNTTVGYYPGGAISGSTPSNIVDKFDYSSETTSTGTSLSTARQGIATIGIQAFGIFAFGTTDFNGTPHLDKTEKYTYSGDNIETIGSTLYTATEVFGGNDGDEGLFAGGVTSGTGGRTNDVTKFNFANETYSAVSSGLDNFVSSVDPAGTRGPNLGFGV